jgi:uncharacterized membrane protein
MSLSSRLALRDGSVLHRGRLNHFRAPEFYLPIMPPYLPWHEQLSSSRASRR